MSVGFSNGYCYGQEYPEYMTSTKVADILIAIAYFTIPMQMFYYGYKERLKSNYITWLFIAFIFFCGCTHLFQVFLNQTTLVWVLGVLKWITALVSVACALAMIKEVPRLASLERNVVDLREQILQMTSYIFHEIRVPLNSMKIGVNNLIRSDGEFSEDSMQTLQIIEKSLNNISYILDDILDIHKIRSGRFEVHKQPTLVSEIVSTVVASFTQVAEHKQLDFKIDAPSSLLKYVIEIDSVRIIQCLNNLLSNAFKHTATGSVTFQVTETAQDIIFTVIDTGCGISIEGQKSLFKPYIQLNTESSGEIGTGLGLVIAKQIANMHGGDIVFTSQEGVGSSFSLKIEKNICTESIEPHTEDHIDLVEQSKINKASTGERQRRGKCLVVDDNEDNKKVMKIYLRMRGLHADLAGNGQEAVKIITECPDYDMIIMDRHMPIMDGLEATKAIRALGVEIPIIVLSGMITEMHQEAFITAGANHIMSKPLAYDKFDLILSDILSNPKHNSNTDHIEIKVI